MTTNTLIRLDAPNDANGNPRRLLLDVTTGQAHDIGYGGEGARRVVEVFGTLARWDGLSVVTTPGEYRRLLKRSKALGFEQVF